TIEVVVDRFRVRADVAQRLAESFDTALKLSGGTARLAAHASGGATAAMVPASTAPADAEQLFSSQHACPKCGYSVPKLEPKMFSFNSPAGACPTCNGLGQQQVFDPQRVIAHPHLSLAGGAVRGWDRRNVYYFQMLQSLAKHYKFDVETPWSELPAKIQRAVMQGSGNVEIEFRYAEGRGKTRRRKHAFEGILPNLERRYRETESVAVREELSKYLGTQPCPDCGGARLNRTARSVLVNELTLPTIEHLSVAAAHELFASLQIAGWRGEIAARIVKEVGDRLRFLIDVGLDYLTLDRSAETLSGGEAQRIRLASQVGSGLTGVMYILDEPSIGLHQRDNQRLLATLKHLRDLGNTVIVVEHDEEAIRAADHVIDIGPGAGIHGGKVVAQGTADEISAAPESLTGGYLSGRERIPVPPLRAPRANAASLRIVGASGNNLQDVTTEFPVGLMTCVTGVSGSGKSTLVNETLFKQVANHLNRSGLDAAPCKALEGAAAIDRVIEIDQSPIGRTPRSNPATYTGLFTPLRELFAAVPEARTRGYDAGRFSFNVKG
ncbi:MAG: excinuclease ABC subunit UvrA, partial [Pseudomonadales bacterium]|nr:excinuclease ABC subunit UvrA [Pseudomonadales bacterium]